MPSLDYNRFILASRALHEALHEGKISKVRKDNQCKLKEAFKAKMTKITELI